MCNAGPAFCVGAVNWDVLPEREDVVCFFTIELSESSPLGRR